MSELLQNDGARHGWFVVPSFTRKQTYPRPTLNFPIFAVQGSGKVVYGKVATMAKESPGKHPGNTWVVEEMRELKALRIPVGRDLHTEKGWWRFFPVARPSASLHLSNEGDLRD